MLFFPTSEIDLDIVFLEKYLICNFKWHTVVICNGFFFLICCLFILIWSSLNL